MNQVNRTGFVTTTLPYEIFDTLVTGGIAAREVTAPNGSVVRHLPIRSTFEDAVEAFGGAWHEIPEEPLNVLRLASNGLAVSLLAVPAAISFAFQGRDNLLT